MEIRDQLTPTYGWVACLFTDDNFLFDTIMQIYRTHTETLFAYYHANFYAAKRVRAGMSAAISHLPWLFWV